MIYNREARIGAEIVLPENLGTFVLRELRHDALFQGHSVGDAFVGVLTPPEGDPVEIILPVRFPTFDRMRRGAVVIAVDAFKERFYTGLQVNRDPGVWVVYTGFILMLIGCYVTFFMSHQQLCVEVAGRSAKTRVRVSGTANKNQPALARRIDQLTQALKESTSP
jgi:cytochrome c biogenesis protein